MKPVVTFLAVTLIVAAAIRYGGPVWHEWRTDVWPEFREWIRR